MARRLMLAQRADRHMQILDLSACGISIIRRPSVISLLKKIAHETQIYYPELLMRMIVCFGGYVFSMGYAIVKGLLDERVQKKIRDGGNSAESIAKELQEQNFDLGTMPALYGGALADLQSSTPHQCMQEIADKSVPPGTAPLNASGFRGDFPPPPPPPPQAASASKNDGDDDDDENNNSVRRLERHESMESCDSGDLQEADVVISSPQASPMKRSARRQSDDDDDDQDGSSGGVQIQMNLSGERDRSNENQQHQQEEQQLQEQQSSSPATAPTATTSSGSSLLAAMRLPPRCVHLFVRLKNHSAFPDPRITARTEFMKRGQAPGAPLVRSHAEIAATLEKTGAFFVIGSKVMAVPESSNSGQPPSSPSCVAEFVGESSQLRRHLLVIDAHRRVHFVLQRGAVHNEVRVMRPTTGILPEVDQDRCSFRGPAERVILARVRPDGGAGGWIAMRDEEAAAAAANNGSSNSAEAVPLARCVEFPMSSGNSGVASDLFMVPRGHKFERGLLERRSGATAFHRHISFEQEFLSAPVPVLAAMTAAIDALMLEAE